MLVFSPAHVPALRRPLDRCRYRGPIRGSRPSALAGLHHHGDCDAGPGEWGESHDVRHHGRADVQAAEVPHSAARGPRVYWQWTTMASGRPRRPRNIPASSTSLARPARSPTWRSSPNAAFRSATGGGAQRPVAAVSASYFRFFDAQPARPLLLGGGRRDATGRGRRRPRYAYWRAPLMAAHGCQVLEVGDIRATIVGVAPEGFDGLNDGRPPAVFVPISTYAASTGTERARTYFSAYKWAGSTCWSAARRGPMSRRRPRSDAHPQGLLAKFRSDNPTSRPGKRPTRGSAVCGLRTGAGPIAGPEARTALWLFGVASAVLLIGCANVANLSLSRSFARRRKSRQTRTRHQCRRLMIGAYAEATLLAICGGIAALADCAVDQDRSRAGASIASSGGSRVQASRTPPHHNARRLQRRPDRMAAVLLPRRGASQPRRDARGHRGRRRARGLLLPS